MKFDTIWPRHVPKGLSLSREEYRSVRDRAKTLREREPNFRDARRKDRRLYLVVALPGTLVFVYLMVYAEYFWIGFAIAWMMLLYARHTTQRTHQPFMRRATCEAGHEVCIDCGYLLRCLPDDVERCPECGAVREYRDVARAVREIVADESVSESAFIDHNADGDEPEDDCYKPLPKYRWD